MHKHLRHTQSTSSDSYEKWIQEDGRPTFWHIIRNRQNKADELIEIVNETSQ